MSWLNSHLSAHSSHPHPEWKAGLQWQVLECIVLTLATCLCTEPVPSALPLFPSSPPSRPSQCPLHSQSPAVVPSPAGSFAEPHCWAPTTPAKPPPGSHPSAPALFSCPFFPTDPELLSLHPQPLGWADTTSELTRSNCMLSPEPRAPGHRKQQWVGTGDLC